MSPLHGPLNEILGDLESAHRRQIAQRRRRRRQARMAVALSLSLLALAAVAVAAIPQARHLLYAPDSHGKLKPIDNCKNLGEIGLLCSSPVGDQVAIRTEEGGIAPPERCTRRSATVKTIHCRLPFPIILDYRDPKHPQVLRDSLHK